MNVRALACRNMDPHAGTAEQKCSFVFSLGDHRADPQPHSVEHKIGVVRIAVLFHAEVEDLPSLLFQVSDDRLFQRKARKVCADYKILVFYRFHFHTPYSVFYIFRSVSPAVHAFVSERNFPCRQNR